MTASVTGDGAERLARPALSGHTGHVLARVLALPMVTCCMLVAASSAAAETRTAHADDGRDRLMAAPGLTADVQAVDVTYDSAGRLDATMTFHDPIASLDGLRVLVDVGQRPNRAAPPVNDPLADGDEGCPIETNGDVRLGVDFGNGTALITGSDALPSSFPATLSPDGRQLSMSFTSSAIAGRDFQCVDASVGAPAFKTDVVPWFWFAGFPRVVALPRMTASQARRLAREAIRRYTKRFARGIRIGRCKRRSSASFRCPVRFRLGSRLRFRGTLRVYYYRLGDDRVGRDGNGALRVTDRACRCSRRMTLWQVGRLLR